LPLCIALVQAPGAGLNVHLGHIVRATGTDSLDRQVSELLDSLPLPDETENVIVPEDKDMRQIPKHDAKGRWVKAGAV